MSLSVDTKLKIKVRDKPLSQLVLRVEGSLRCKAAASRLWLVNAPAAGLWLAEGSATLAPSLARVRWDQGWVPGGGGSRVRPRLGAKNKQN